MPPTTLSEDLEAWDAQARGRAAPAAPSGRAASGAATSAAPSAAPSPLPSTAGPSSEPSPSESSPGAAAAAALASPASVVRPHVAASAAGCLLLALVAAALPPGVADLPGAGSVVVGGGAPAAAALFGQAHAAGLLAGAGTGALLAHGMGPQYQVSREPDIPVGSMVVPQDAKELVVVVDTRSALQRGLTAAAGAAAVLAALAAAGTPA
eukprot:365910-Chlamydomonas_euryale.AAC.32